MVEITTTPLRPIAQSSDTAPTQQPAAPTTEQPTTTGDRLKSYMRVKVGTLEFNSLDGDILGNPYIRLSTYQHSSTKFIVNDPDDTIRPEIAKQQDVEVEIGYVNGEKQNVFIGKIYSIGRVPPDGTEVEAIDSSYQMQETGSSVQVASEQPAANSLVANTAAVTSALENVMAQQTSGNSFAELTNLLEQTSQTVRGDRPNVTPAEQFTAENANLRFVSSSSSATGAEGSVRLQQSQMGAATNQAALQGDVVISRGNTVRQVAPGAGESSGVVLDYAEDRSVFIGRPRVTKKTGLQLQSQFGSISVVGWSSNDKQTVGATVVTPGPAPAFAPNASISAPEWGSVKVGDPIYSGSLYTWADATMNGTRVPASKSIMDGIVAIAQVLDQLTRQYNGGRKFQINSWYRPPAVNRRVGGATNSRHLQGDAVDFSGNTMTTVYRALQNNYDGGLAIKSGSFVHIDRGPRRRWTY